MFASVAVHTTVQAGLFPTLLVHLRIYPVPPHCCGAHLPLPCRGLKIDDARQCGQNTGCHTHPCPHQCGSSSRALSVAVSQAVSMEMYNTWLQGSALPSAILYHHPYNQSFLYTLCRSAWQAWWGSWLTFSAPIVQMGEVSVMPASQKAVIRACTRRWRLCSRPDNSEKTALPATAGCAA